MSLSALIIGYGSIGKRHAEIIDTIDEISRVSVLSSQKDLPFNTLTSLEDIPGLDPDYIVVASPTAHHYPQLNFLEDNLENKIILVEKPLFEKTFNLVPIKNSVWVAYVFRFHPLMQMIKEKVSQKSVWNMHVFCGSYLPDWRPDRDYRETYSTRKDLGGGVLLDLSHELDYAQWLLGPMEIDYVFNNKISSLEIDSDDLLTFHGHTHKNTQVQINLNYFTKKPIRQIIIDGETISIQADLIKGKATVHSEGEIEEYDWSDIEINEIYRREHEAVLDRDSRMACTYEEGLETMHLIDNIKTFNKQ